MDSHSLGLIFVLAGLIFMSAYFSATETAFSAFNRIRVKNMAASGNRRAKLVMQLSENYDKLLSTILIGNNIVNITSASLATVIFVKYFGDVGVTISTVVMTVLVLIFGEISPKSLAKDAPESFAMFSAPFLRVLILVLTPLNFLFTMWKKFLSLFIKPKEEPGMTEEELLTLVDEAQSDGELEEQEGELIKSAIEFHDVLVEDVLTPRVEVVALEAEEGRDKAAELFRESGFSRLPVYEQTIDHIIGVLNQKDFYASPEKEIKKLIKPIFYTPDSARISHLLKTFQQTKSHIAVVTDEYGGTAGIVTLEDMIEELVGEIWDEHEEAVEELVAVGDQKYRVLGSMNLNKLMDFFDMEEENDASTVSGWVIQRLHKIPNEGDHFTDQNLEVEVLKTSYQRVVEVEITQLVSKEVLA